MTLAKATSIGLGYPNIRMAGVPGHPGVQSKDTLQKNIREVTLAQVVENLRTLPAQAVVGGEPGGEADPLYDQAVDIVLRTRRASISLVQRHLRIGYNRAARLIEQMEQSGLVSPMQSNGNREVLGPRYEE